MSLASPIPLKIPKVSKLKPQRQVGLEYLCYDLTLLFAVGAAYQVAHATVGEIVQQIFANATAARILNSLLVVEGIVYVLFNPLLYVTDTNCHCH